MKNNTHKTPMVFSWVMAVAYTILITTNIIAAFTSGEKDVGFISFSVSFAGLACLYYIKAVAYTKLWLGKKPFRPIEFYNNLQTLWASFLWVVIGLNLIVHSVNNSGASKIGCGILVVLCAVSALFQFWYGVRAFRRYKIDAAWEKIYADISNAKDYSVAADTAVCVADLFSRYGNIAIAENMPDLQAKWLVKSGGDVLVTTLTKPPEFPHLVYSRVAKHRRDGELIVSVYLKKYQNI